MKFIVTKITQSEESVLVESATEADAFNIYTGGYGSYSETQDKVVSKITVQPIIDAPTSVVSAAPVVE